MEPSCKRWKCGCPTNLGKIYEKGEGVTKNHKTLVKCYTGAAGKENSAARANFGAIV